MKNETRTKKPESTIFCSIKVSKSSDSIQFLLFRQIEKQTRNKSINHLECVSTKPEKKILLVNYYHTTAHTLAHVNFNKIAITSDFIRITFWDYLWPWIRFFITNVSLLILLNYLRRFLWEYKKLTIWFGSFSSNPQRHCPNIRLNCTLSLHTELTSCLCTF